MDCYENRCTIKYIHILYIGCMNVISLHCATLCEGNMAFSKIHRYNITDIDITCTMMQYNSYTTLPYCWPSTSGRWLWTNRLSNGVPVVFFFTVWYFLGPNPVYSSRGSLKTQVCLKCLIFYEIYCLIQACSTSCFIFSPLYCF